MSKVSKVEAGKDLRESITEVLEPLGGIENFVEEGDVVFLKPNFNTADPYPASTDLEFLKEMVRIVYGAGAKMVITGDSSTMSINTEKVMKKLGVFELEKMERPPRVYVFDEREWVEKKIPGAKYLKEVSLTYLLDRVDKLILLPCLKTHFQAKFTGALKLSVGFMNPPERVSLHLNHIQEKIAELNKIIHPDLVVMDARKCFINKGPSKGEVREPNLILASEGRVALDEEGVRVIQSFEGNSLRKIEAEELTQIKRAREIGVE